MEDVVTPPREANGPRRLFDVVQANALVPVLERVFSRVRAYRNEMHSLVEELREDGIEPKLTAPEAMPPMERGAQVAFDRLRQLYDEVVSDLEELTEMGVEVKGLDGLVDVRSLYQGEEVYLCWRYGEPRFAFWHTLDSGYKGRRRIVDADDFSGTLLC